MQDSQKIKIIDIPAEISHNSDLMALPDVVMEILEMAAKDEISIDSLSNTISRDPALAGRLLKIANSPFYGLTNTINNIHQAVMVLGITTVKCLALSAAIFNCGKIKGTFGINISTIYTNIISVAITSRKIAMACNYPTPEDAFTCGLFQDVGLLYFLHHHPENYGSVINNTKKSGSLFEEEKKIFGITHHDVGKIIAQKWRLPQHIITGIGEHNNPGNKSSDRFEDIIRLAVVLSRDIYFGSEEFLEDKITKISFISGRLGLKTSQLDEIVISSVKDSLAFAKAAEIEVEDYETILARANQEIFNTYMTIQNLFRERQDLTRKILEEEREKGLLEAKSMAVSTLSHYVNNAIMAISGNSQVIRMTLMNKTPEVVIGMLPRQLDVIDSAIRKIAAVLEELSELHSLENIEFFKQSKIIDIDDRIKSRMERLKNESGIVLPQEADIDAL
jgi:HD-like signal output (HDOD) protein